MTVHELKCWPEFFGALFAGDKRAEVRRNDRDYKAGDYLELKEWDPRTGKFTGQRLSFLVTAAWDLSLVGCSGFVELDLRPLFDGGKGWRRG